MSQSILTNSNLECRSTSGNNPTLLKLAFTDATLRLEGATSGTKVILDNVAEPTQSAHSATKAYVDNAVSGISMGLAWKDAVQVRTTENLVATYSGGTLTADVAGFIPAIDGYTPVTEDRVLVMNQTDPAHNGIYRVTSVGDNNTAYALDRSSDASSIAGTSDLRRGATFVETGTTYGGRGYVESGEVTALGTSPITYSLMATISEVSATDGLEASGKNIRVKTGRGIGIISDEVALNDLGVVTGYLADLAVTTSKIEDGNVTAPKLSSGCIDNSNKFLGGVVDNTALGPNSVTDAKLASKTITNVSITNGTLTEELYQDNSVGNSALATNSVGNTNIIDGAVTSGKIGNGQVLQGNVGNGAIVSAAIGGGEVKQINIGSQAIITSHIVNGNITTGLLNQTAGQQAVTTDTIRDANVTQAKLSHDSVGADQLIAQSVGEPAIADACITDRHIGSLSNLTLSGELVASSVVVGGSGGSTSYALAKMSHLNYNFVTPWSLPDTWGMVPAADSVLSFPYSDKVSALNFTAALPILRTNATGTDVEMAIQKRLWNSAGTALEAPTYEGMTVAQLYDDEMFAMGVVNTLILKSSGAGGDNYVGEVTVLIQKMVSTSTVVVPSQGDLQMIGLIVSDNSGTTQLTYSA
jgi:hypothetical protein